MSDNLSYGNLGFLGEFVTDGAREKPLFAAILKYAIVIQKNTKEISS